MGNHRQAGQADSMRRRVLSSRLLGPMTIALGLGFIFQGLYFFWLARLLGPSQLGKFSASLAIVSIAAYFTGLGSGNVLVQRVSREAELYARQFGASLFYIGLSALTLGGTVAVAVHVLSPSLQTIAYPLIISELAFGRLADLSLQIFQAREALHITALLTVLYSAARFATMPLAVALHIDTARGFSILYAGSTIVSSLVGAAIAIRRYGPPVFTRAAMKDTWRTGTAFAVGQASKSVYSDLDKYMLALYSSSSSAGLYTVAYRVISMAFTPAQAAVYSSNTALFRAGAESFDAVWKVAKPLLRETLIFATVSMLVICVANPLLPALAGNAYKPAASMLIWLSPMLLIQTAHYVLGDSLMGRGRQSLRASMQIASALVALILNVVLIPRLGWRGAVVSSWCSELFLVCSFSFIVVVSLKRERVERSISPIAQHTRT